MPRPCSRRVPARSPALLLALAVAACTPATRDAGEVVATAEAFLAGQRAGDFAAAFALLHPALHARCGTPEALATRVREAGEVPLQWRLDMPQVLAHTAELRGELRRSDGLRSVLLLAFDRTDRGWTITGWTSGTRDLCR